MTDLTICALYWGSHHTRRTAIRAARAVIRRAHAALRPPAPLPVWRVLPTAPAYHHRPLLVPEPLPHVALVRPYAPTAAP